MRSSSEAKLPFLANVEDNSSSEKDIPLSSSTSSSTFTFPLPCSQPRRDFRFLAVSIFVLLLTNIATFSFMKWRWEGKLDGICALHTSRSWSPILRDVDITYTTTMFNGTFLKDTIFRQPPSPEVDAAWKTLGVSYRNVILTPEEALRSNIPPDRVKVDERYGGPGYPAINEGIHQLHCLDLLRKSNYFNYDYYHKLSEGPFLDPEDILKAHISHCIEYIRQQLMCSADTGMHPFLWARWPGESKPHIFPDFNREHKCKNFDAIRAWSESHQVEYEHIDIEPGEGDLILSEIP